MRLGAGQRPAPDLHSKLNTPSKSICACGTSSAALVTVTDALVVPGKGKGKGGGRGKGGEDGGRGGGKPGAARGAATWPDATHMKLGNRVYDVAAIGSHYALDKDHCFPVLLSIKKGADRLALCPHWGKEGHTSLTSAKHTTPKDFNSAKVPCRPLLINLPTPCRPPADPRLNAQHRLNAPRRFERAAPF